MTSRAIDVKPCSLEFIGVLGQPKWISGSKQHFGWIRGGAGGESDRRVRLNRTSKMVPDINPKLNSNPKPRTDRVPQNRSDSSKIA